MENEKITNCNQCPNHCPADALQCGKGRHYFEQLENPDAAAADGGEHRGHGEGHGNKEGHGHGEGHGNKEGHGHGEGHGHREGHHGKSDDLYGLMRACGHYLHHSGGKHQDGSEKNHLFSALDETEQETLKGLLKKLTDSWEQ